MFVPTLGFRRYSDDGSYVLGCKFKSDNNVWIETSLSSIFSMVKEKNASTSKDLKGLLEYSVIYDTR